jgi:NAD/NADP transhydrogenase beta subunit
MRKFFPGKGFMIFAGVVFWPVLVPMALFLSGVPLTLLIAFSDKTSGIRIQDLAEILFFALTPLYILLVSYRQCVKATWKQRWWIIYFTWMSSNVLLGFILCAAVGGASMAVVDGVAGHVLKRYAGYMIGALEFAVCSNVFVIPWVFFSVYCLKKIGEDKVFQDV